MSEPKVRRQNHSCDHCRKSKKACDGYILNNNRHTNSPDATSTTSHGQIYADIEPGLKSCSYCTRTKKACSLNPHWGKSTTRASASASSITSASEDGNSQTKRKRNDFAEIPNIPTIPSKDVDLNAASMLNMLQTPAPGQCLPWDTPLPSLEVSSLLAMNPALDAQCLGMNFSSPESDSQATAQDFIDEALAELTHQTSHDGTDAFDNSTTYSGSQEFDIHTLWDFSEINSAPQDSASSARSPSYAPNAVQRKRRSRLPSNDWSGFPTGTPSPFNSDSLIMESSNRHFITESLLQIYHDVLENNLACWLAEENCPYKMERRSSSPEDTTTALTIAAGGHHQSPPFPPEWGTAWSNRMYRRVIQLDRVAQATKMIRLTRAESQAASRVLDLVIMAFTTQWAQGSRRQEQFPMGPSDFDADIPEDLAEAMNKEFEESFQQSVWEQAKRALIEVADVESYRVIYAELIFGLTQKPWVTDDYQPKANAFRTTKNGGKGIKESTMPEIIDIMTQEGPHIYLERAVRKIHALKFKFEASESGFAETSKGYAPQRFTVEDRRTIGLLYWMAVMFDTVSSTMNERPLALTDEDCQHEGTLNAISENAESALKAQQVSQRWEIELFIQDNAAKPALVTRWPCSYDDAMQTVAKSAPVKILIYRHLSYLQNALRKRECGQAIEDIIQQTTMVYRYWNMTHGAFFRDLVKHYDTVPPRIRSWFFCIAVPWHLGALMLADLLEFIDDNELGLKQARQKRHSGNVAARIRKASAIELSDLARVTTPRVLQEAGANAAQLPDYHFAVSEGPLLTEPWTVILIRAFTKACIFHLDMADDFQQHERDFLGHDNEDFKDSLRRAEYCIQALWCLGKKSEMSRNITKVLTGALRELKL